MARKLLFIANDGGEENHLDGIQYDKRDYLDFFHLPEGGYWHDEEIQIYDNSANLQQIRSQLIGVGTDYFDYIVIVFSGHGCANRFGETFFELSQGHEASLGDFKGLRNITGTTRYLVIADSCRTIPRFQQGGRLEDHRRLFAESRDNDVYKERCRQLYDEAFIQLPARTFCIGYATSLGHGAIDLGDRGGLYSQALLQATKNEIGRVKTEHQGDSVISFREVHQVAVNNVSALTQGQQIPDYECSNGTEPPFAVVPLM